MTLFDRHAIDLLLGYRHNLESILETVASGNIPAANDPAIQPHVDALRRHMASAMPEADDFLLRFGLTVPGKMRGIKPPLAVLAPGRGGFSEARIREAAAQVGRLQEALTLATWCFGDLGPDKLAQLGHLAERLKAQRASAASDPSWVEAHAGLPDDEAVGLAGRAIQCLDAPAEAVRELGLNILRSLADFREVGLGGFTSELLRRGIFYPPSLYRDADETVGEGIVAGFDGTLEDLELDHRLLALAWTRGEAARRAFVQWRRVPPAWVASLHVPTEDYLPSAGWTIDEEGQRRELISMSCYRFAPQSSTPVHLFELGPAIPCRMPLEESCPACGSALAWLFDFSLLSEDFFSEGRAAAPRRVLACLGCACSCTVFTRYRENGTAEWHPATESEETSSIEPVPATIRQLLASPQPPFAAVEPFGIADATSLGGIPMWLQDAEYPICPDCEEVMTFLAQFDNGSMPDAEEGIFYSFFCDRCRTAAVSYQQT